MKQPPYNEVTLCIKKRSETSVLVFKYIIKIRIKEDNIMLKPWSLKISAASYTFTRKITAASVC